MSLRHFYLWLILALFALGSAVASSGARRCSLCGNAIGASEQYYQVKDSDEIFCEHCYADAPRCDYCKLPVAQELLDPETGICTKCLDRLPKCKACGKPITGTFYKYSSSDGVFCAECKNNRPTCAICDAPLGTTYWKYPDGRKICSDCTSRAIFDERVIAGIVQDVRATMERLLNLRIANPLRLTIQNLSGLSTAGIRHKERADALDEAFFGKELGWYHFENGRSEIHLLYGLPPDLLYEAAAHECAHAWQMEHSLVNLTPELREGYAQWVAAEILREKGFRDAWERLDARRDYPYGTGYQQLKSMEQKIVFDLGQKKH
jgi:hypothetical protein